VSAVSRTIPIRPCPPAEHLETGPEKSVSLWTEADASAAASRCLALRPCESCDLCRMLCPELCITRDPASGRIEIDDAFCKGCGICAFVCPKGAIRMERE
jgi:Pyruvate/2-oxoacid:ferredoxin oxidoreductase delta subunit